MNIQYSSYVHDRCSPPEQEKGKGRGVKQMTKKRKKRHTLEDFEVETDLGKELVLGATGFG